MISIVIIGGAGSLKASIVGSALLIALPEALRFIGMPNQGGVSRQQLIFANRATVEW